MPHSPLWTGANLRPVPETGLWQDVAELAESLTATLDAREGFDDAAALLGADGVQRIVATGNGAAYYVAVALWLASLESVVEVVAVPSGLVARDQLGRAAEVGIDVVAGRRTVSLALVDVVHGAHVDASLCGESLDHRRVRTGEDAAAAEHAEPEAHALVRATR